MKRFPFLSMVTALVLAVTAFSCTTLQEADRDEYYERVSSTPNRIYIDDPYRGTVVLERDPYTGRYYDVNAFGYGRSSGYGYGNDRYYGRNTYPRSDRRIYRSPQQNTPQPPSQEQIRQREKSREEARNKVLGGN